MKNITIRDWQPSPVFDADCLLKEVRKLFAPGVDLIVIDVRANGRNGGIDRVVSMLVVPERIGFPIELLEGG
jgi:hypothetical protein